MDKKSGDRSRPENVTSGTPNRGRNPYTHTKMPLDQEQKREREDTKEELEEE